MGKKTKKEKELDTIWEIPDALWELIEPILLEDCPPKAGPGRDRIDWRQALNGIIFRMRSGCQWNRLPNDFGDDSSIHRWFQRWNRNGVMERIWAMVVEACAELGGVNWEWQSADGAMAKARFGGDKIGPNPTDRAKMGTKRSILVEEQGGPLGAVIEGANVHDTKMLDATIEAIVVERPKPTAEDPQNLCLDKGYDNPTGHQTTKKHKYIPHIRPIGEEKPIPRGKKNTSHAAGSWSAP